MSNVNQCIDNDLPHLICKDCIRNGVCKQAKQTQFHQSIRRIYSAVNLLSREETQALLSHALYQYELKD